MTKLRLALIASMAVGISACSQKENNHSVTGNNKPIDDTTSITGTVADGYLVGATICLDLNENGDCDAGEPSAITQAGGAYTLNNVSTANSIAYPIVAKIGADTIDEDTGAEVVTAYFMSAPANSGGFVSPLTTLVHSKRQSNPALSLREAEDAVIRALGFDPASPSPVSLFEDFVAASRDDQDENTADYKHIYDVARVTASVIASNYKAVAASSENVRTDVLMQLVANNVLAQLSSIAVDVEAATKIDGTLNSEELGNISDTVNNVDVSTLLQQVAAIYLVDDTSAESSLLTWIENDFSLISADREAQRFAYWTNSKNTDKNRITSVEYTYKNNNWILDADEDENRAEDENVRLTSTGWLNVPDDTRDLEFAAQEDGSLRLFEPTTRHNIASIKSVPTNDIAGDKISQFLLTSGDNNMSDFGVDASAVFSEGAQAFLLFLEGFGQWEIAYSGCPSDQAAYTLSAGTNCSVARNQGSPLEQLDGVIGVSHNIGDNTTVNIVGSATDSSGLATITVLEGNSVKVEVNSTWAKRTINTEDLIVIEIPISVRTYVWGGDNVTKAFFSKFDGYVRSGWYNSPEIESQWAFNNTALDDLLANFSTNATNVFVPAPTDSVNPTPLTACTNGNTENDDSNNPPISLKSFSEFEDTVEDCITSTALTLTMEQIEGNTYLLAGDDGVTITFAIDGVFTVGNEEAASTSTWSIDDSDYLVLLEDGGQVRTSIKIVESANSGEELSLKLYTEARIWSDMNRNNGKDGEIKSFVMSKI